MSGDHKRGVAMLGRAYVGKTEVANALVKAGVCDLRASFAGELKADLAALGCNKGDPGFREVAIAYGTDHKRAISQDYWLERLRVKLHDDLDGIVVDDVRFANEVAFLRDRDFLIVKLVARGDVRLDRGCPLDFVTSSNISEAGLDSELGDLVLDTGVLSPSACVVAIAAAMQRVAA